MPERRVRRIVIHMSVASAERRQRRSAVEARRRPVLLHAWNRPDMQQRELLEAARRGDGGARERLVRSCLPLVRAVARRYRDFGLPLDDLVQKGTIGLLEAIDRFDPERGIAFETYVRFRVRRAVTAALTDQARLIRLPKHVVERRRALDRAANRLVAAGRLATPAELATITGLPLRAVLEAQTVTEPPVSLDARWLPDGSSLEGELADPSASDPAAATIERERHTLLALALKHLSERQRHILATQWNLHDEAERSVAELARELHLSPRRTQTIGREALESLRRELDPVRS
jgi:RNA polymerase sigma factor (sigma-70 family)